MKISDDVVSIIMPMYNSEKYVEESIKSVMEQTYTKWELIIVDDCSVDNSKKIARSYSFYDKRIKVICLEKNQGVACARNKGIELANGRYIAFLDSDDLWLPNKLEHQIQFMKNNNIAISCTQYRQFFNDDCFGGKLIDVDEKIEYEDLLRGNVLGCLTVMIDRKFVGDIYMPSIRHEDYITWLNISKKGVIVYGIKEDLARYRKCRKSLSGNKVNSILWTWNVYRESQNLSIVESLYYFCHYAIKGAKKHLI